MADELRENTGTHSLNDLFVCLGHIVHVQNTLHHKRPRAYSRFQVAGSVRTCFARG